MTEQQKPFFSENYELENQKPISDINLLMSRFSPISNKLETINRQVINYHEKGLRRCFLLHKGTVSLYRSTDSMVLNTESAPYVFGLSTQLTDSEYLFMRTHDSSDVSWLPIEEANRIIARHNLWKSLSQLLIYTVTRVYDHCSKISSLSSYEIIRYQLYELMNEMPELRNSVTIANYIQCRTFLSRSSIMKILAQLKAGNYITTERGLLIAINNIPLRY